MSLQILTSFEEHEQHLMYEWQMAYQIKGLIKLPLPKACGIN